MDISFSLIEKTLSELSKTSSTYASFNGANCFVPMKIKFEDFSARIDFALSLPRTKHKASVIFDLPEPFGPITQLISGLNGTSVFLGKLLNPCITSFFIYGIL